MELGGVKLSRVRSSGISSPELVILFCKVGQGPALGECVQWVQSGIGGPLGKPWPLLCLQGLTPGVRLAATQLYLLLYSTWVTCVCRDLISNLHVWWSE